MCTMVCDQNQLSCTVLLDEEFGTIPAHRAAPIIDSTAATYSAFFHPIRAARIGVRSGEIAPPILLPQFMTPPAIPLRAPAISIMVAHAGPSTDRTHAVANAKYRTAALAL